MRGQDTRSLISNESYPMGYLLDKHLKIIGVLMQWAKTIIAITLVLFGNSFPAYALAPQFNNDTYDVMLSNAKVARMKALLRERSKRRTKYNRVEIVDRMIDHLRIITREELEHRVRQMVHALNHELRKHETYAVLWDHKTHKSRRWIFTMALPWLEKPPAVAAYMTEAGYERVRRVKPSAIVIFDEAIYSGMDIVDTLSTIHREFRKSGYQKTILAIPFIGAPTARELQQWPDVQFLTNNIGESNHELLPSLGQVLTPQEIGHDDGDFYWQHLAVFEHKGPPDTFSIPSSLFKLFWGDFYWKFHRNMDKDPDASIPTYKQPGPYYDQEEREFLWGAVGFTSDGAMEMTTPNTFFDNSL